MEISITQIKYTVKNIFRKDYLMMCKDAYNIISEKARNNYTYSMIPTEERKHP